MILRNAGCFRQDIAHYLPAGAQAFARAGDAATVQHVPAARLSINPERRAVRNPSPWRQSGAKLHVLPPFFARRRVFHKTERERSCSKLLNSLPSQPSHSVLPVACSPQAAAFSLLPQAQPLARSQVQPLVAATPTSQPVPSLAASQARLSQPSNTAFKHRCARDFPPRHFTASAALSARTGGALRLPTSRQRTPHV